MRARQVRVSGVSRLFFGVLGWPFRLLGALLRGIGTMLGWVWPVAALVVAVLIWGAPAVLWEYQYIPRGKARIYLACTFLTIQGPAKVGAIDGTCPYVTLLPLRLEQLWKSLEG